MKITIALLSIGAFCLSTVEAITSNHNYYHKLQFNPPCEEGDYDCWVNVGRQCDLDDDKCLALALGVKKEYIPDCEKGDDGCWAGFWNDFWNSLSDDQSHHLRRIVNQHMKVSKENHKAVYY